MSSPSEQSSPFLAVLMSEPPAQTGDDDPQPPRVRGLGFVY